MDGSSIESFRALNVRSSFLTNSKFVIFKFFNPFNHSSQATICPLKLSEDSLVHSKYLLYLNTPFSCISSEAGRSWKGSRALTIGSESFWRCFSNPSLTAFPMNCSAKKSLWSSSQPHPCVPLSNKSYQTGSLNRKYDMHYIMQIK